MIKILTHKDDYKKYEDAVEQIYDCLEDWDYIIILDKQVDNDYASERIADKLEVSGNKYYKTSDGEDFIVVYH